MMICMYQVKNVLVCIGLKKLKLIRHTIKCTFVGKEEGDDDMKSFSSEFGELGLV